MADSKQCAGDDEIAAYVDGSLSDGRVAAIEAHLDACHSCARVVTEAAKAAHSARSDRKIGPRATLRIFDIGQSIADRYDIVAFLGAGGMGEVYEAHDRVLGDEIALKTVSAAASFDERAVQRLKAEVQLARRVTHRNVCRIFDFGIHADEAPKGTAPFLTPFLTMELLRGRPLAEHIRRGDQLPREMLVEVVRQMAAGLMAAHEAGVIHRDLKSDNVLLLPGSRGGFRPVITDFGLAGTMPSMSADGPSARGSVYGTVSYLAPERLAGAPASVLTDIYALGVVIWEMMSGTLALGMAPPGAPSLSPADPLHTVVLGCVEPRPDLRSQSAAEVLEGLERVTRANIPARTEPPRPAAGGPSPRWRSMAVAGVPIALLGGSLAVHFAGPRIGQSPLPTLHADVAVGGRYLDQPRSRSEEVAALSGSVSPGGRESRPRRRTARRPPKTPVPTPTDVTLAASQNRNEHPVADEPIRTLASSIRVVTPHDDDAPISSLRK